MRLKDDMNRLLGLLFITLALACSCEKSTTTQPAGADTTSHNFVWETDSLNPPDAFQIRLTDIWGASENSVWAVGHADVTKYTVWHWNGNGWQNRHLQFGVSYSISAIYGFSANDIWMVGNSYSHTPSEDFRNVIIHNDGGTWRLITEIDAPSCYSVWGTSSSDLFVGCDSGLILHYDGGQWGKQTLSTPYAQIHSILGFSTNEVYALGGHPDFVQPGDSTFFYFYKYDGKQWEVLQTFIEYPNAPSRLFGTKLWGTANRNLYSAGLSGIYEYSENKWRRIENFESLRSLNGSNRNDVFIGGFKNRLHHFNGDNWHTYNELSDPARWISAIWILNNSLYLCSTTGFKTQMIRGYRVE